MVKLLVKLLVPGVGVQMITVVDDPSPLSVVVDSTHVCGVVKLLVTGVGVQMMIVVEEPSPFSVVVDSTHVCGVVKLLVVSRGEVVQLDVVVEDGVVDSTQPRGVVVLLEEEMLGVDDAMDKNKMY